MSETIHTILDLSHPVSALSFWEVPGVQDLSSPSNAGVRLSEVQLRALVKVLFAYGLHYDEVLEEQRPLFLKSIMDNEQDLFRLSQTFCEHLMNNLDETAKMEFSDLQKMEWNLQDPLSNERLMDFVEMELLDPTVSFRKWEYGHYSLNYMSTNFFDGIGWEKNGNAIASGNVQIEDHLTTLEDKLDKTENALDSHERNLLQLVAKSRLWPQKTNLVDYIMVGTIVQSNLVGLSLRREKLAFTLKNAIQNLGSRKKNRGGPKP